MNLDWLRRKLAVKPLRMYEDLLWRYFLRGQEITSMKIAARKAWKYLDELEHHIKHQESNLQMMEKHKEAVENMDKIWQHAGHGLPHDWRNIPDAGRIINNAMTRMRNEIRARDKWLKLATNDRMIVVDYLREEVAKRELYEAHREILIKAVRALEGWAVDGFVSWSLVDKNSLNEVAQKCSEALIMVGEYKEHADAPF